MFDVVVVGGGIMGVATAASLARRDRRVVLLEQFEFEHTRGSSHGRARIFRFSYPDAMYVSMAQESLALWTTLEARARQQLIIPTGGLDTGRNLQDHVRALETCGAAFEVLSGDDVNRRFDTISLPRDQQALYQPHAGVIAALRAHAAFKTVAETNGAQLRPLNKVEAVEPEDGKVVVRTVVAEVEAQAVVITAGAWAKQLLAPLGIDLEVRPTRETVAYFAMEGPFPPTLVEWGEPSGYGLGSPGQGIKVGEHQAGPEIDPDEDGPPDASSIERLKDWVKQRYPKAEPEPHLAETCLYTNAPEDRFILERHDRVVVGSPCSGHGFKFAPLIGERLAQLAGEVL
ncbi:MAG TPA: FAD-dependent oxidoreductase [Actinomycetota bacterium]|nr:FAD-dependent oxidoreductase [Actinomycetota bacterium]